MCHQSAVTPAQKDENEGLLTPQSSCEPSAIVDGRINMRTGRGKKQCSSPIQANNFCENEHEDHCHKYPRLLHVCPRALETERVQGVSNIYSARYSTHCIANQADSMSCSHSRHTAA